MLTDRGKEFCGSLEHHEYELYLAIEDIDHSKTEVRHPQANGDLRAPQAPHHSRRVLPGRIPEEDLSLN